tara:strand:- start:2278 stop:2520 length:243 start_codon:yes stop_codon:yes gene_type:complete
MSKIEVDTVSPQSSTTLTIGESGDTIAIGSGASFAATNIADGSVSDSEFQFLDGVSSAIQTQIDTKTSTGKAIAMSIVFG